jgi:CRISPR-associated protein Csm5
LSRSILRRHPLYTRTMQTGLPFPKTRRVVFLNDEPAALPGWVRVDFLET